MGLSQEPISPGIGVGVSGPCGPSASGRAGAPRWGAHSHTAQTHACTRAVGPAGPGEWGRPSDLSPSCPAAGCSTR